MKTIPLTRNQFALVDDDDFTRISAHKWHAIWEKDIRSFCAARNCVTNGVRSKIRMHREVTCAPIGMQVDHVNHNTLDNRKQNLRLCTGSQNQANHRMHSSNSSGYKGVSWNKKSKKWHSYIRINGKRKSIGFYQSAIDAARAYDSVAEKSQGKFALTNKGLGIIP